MSEENKIVRNREMSFYKTTNDVTGEVIIAMATSASTAEASAKKEALKKIASFTTVKLSAKEIADLAASGTDLGSVPVIKAASKKAHEEKKIGKNAPAPAPAPAPAAAPADTAAADKPAEPAAGASAAPVFSASSFAR